ncbi:MAG: glycosyltransferase family 4 protein [Acidobacteria bacterium]|nr:glycosyltransferase family 4 protein [Acidobacteriota bacterium]
MIRVLEFADVINRHDFIDTIVHYADRERFEVSVCVRSEENNIAMPEYPAGTKYKYLPGNSRRDAVATAWKLSRLLRVWKIDILHAHHFEQAIVGWLATRFYRGTKLVIGRHYSDSIYRNPSPIKRKALLAIEQRINRDAARIIVPSQMIFEILTERQGIPAEKIDIVYYGFVPEKYLRPGQAEIEAVREEFGLAGRFTIANFSRYHEEKGHRYLLDAIAELRKDVPDVVALLVGEGPERKELERQIAKLSIAENVILTGWRKDALTIMAAADAVVQSTLQEAFSQVMCEAMWMEKPLVMTDVSGAADIIENGKNGLLVPKGDSGKLAGAVKELHADPEKRKRITEEARRRVEGKFTIDKMIKRYEESFEKALG